MIVNKEKSRGVFMQGYKMAREILLALCDFFLRFTARDYQCVIIILLLASLLRFPFIAHPDHTQFDEVIYVGYTLHAVEGQPYFDIHPPLARMIYAAIANASPPFTTTSIVMDFQQPFGDFPYIPLRNVIALFGILLPVVIFAIGRMFGYAPRVAMLPALFVVFDSALVIYSRVILPDTLLLVCNFTALLAGLAMIRTKNKYLAFLFLIFSGIAIGCALSIKWTALGMLLSLWLLFLLNRRYKEIFITGLMAGIVYVIIFVSFFMSFPLGGSTVSPTSSLNQPWVHAITFPDSSNIFKVLAFLPLYHEAMLFAGKDPNVLLDTMPAPNPLSWPIAKSALIFWYGNTGEQIIFMGNSVLWVLSFFVVLFEIGWIAVMRIKNRKWSVDKYEILLLGGYALNYLPFFLIHRPMYLYHYLTALIFLFLLLPKVAPRITHCFSILTRDRAFAYTFMSVALFLILLNFILTMPITYGY